MFTCGSTPALSVADSVTTSWIRRSLTTSSAFSSPMMILCELSALASSSLFFLRAVTEAL